MNGYESKNIVFSFCQASASFTKNAEILLGNFMRQDDSIAISCRSFSRELSGDSLKNIYGGKNEKNSVKSQLLVSPFRFFQEVGQW